MPRAWLIEVVRLSAVLQARSPVVVPDVFLGQLVWGPRRQPGSWPANWRRTLRDVLSPRAKSGPRQGCREGCPLYGRADLPHRHRTWTLRDTFLGAMVGFATSRGEDGTAVFDFKNRLSAEEVQTRKEELRQEIRGRREFLPTFIDLNPDKEAEARAELCRARAEYKRLRRGARKVSGVRAVYMPVRIFGPSPRSGLSLQQCNVITALTGEITRTRGPTGRKDKAQVVTAGRARRHPRGRPVPVCPSLGQGEWIMFNGTGSGRHPRLHGHGFKLTTWLQKAGYPEGSDCRRLLEDLKALAEPFGLVVAGWNPRTLEWRSLEEVLALGGSVEGSRWLGRCVLRVYTRADYLARWRRYFADKLGFSHIPGSKDEDLARAAAPARPAAVRTANDLQALMKQRGLTDGALAGLLRVDRTVIAKYRTGRRKWGKGFQRNLDAYLSGS
jgi:hypothetical protein